MSWEIDLSFKKNYGTVARSHYPGIFNCSSKGRKSINLSTSAGKTDHLFKNVVTVSFYKGGVLKNVSFK